MKRLFIISLLCLSGCSYTHRLDDSYWIVDGKTETQSNILYEIHEVNNQHPNSFRILWIARATDDFDIGDKITICKEAK